MTTVGSPDFIQRDISGDQEMLKSAESLADSEFFINISERFRWRRRTSAATVRTNRYRNLTVAATIPVSLRAGDEHRRTQMFNRINMIAIALAGAVSAAALTPAMAFTPPHITINGGPPARVHVPTPGGVRPGQPGPDPSSHFETGSCQGCGVTVGGSVNAAKTPPTPAPSSGTGYQ
jgi:hypothetical protein